MPLTLNMNWIQFPEVSRNIFKEEDDEAMMGLRGKTLDYWGWPSG